MTVLSRLCANCVTNSGQTVAVNRVLVVEDDAAIRVMLRQALEDEGYAVVEAPSGASGLDVIRED